jgi:hypothetical protein
MALNPVSSFRQAGLALAAIAGLAYGGAANAQTTMSKTVPVNAPATQTVPRGQCAAFGSYVLDEDDAHPGKLSARFLDTVSRFVSAKCGATDKDGPIYIITMNDQDAASLETALRRMGTFDIIGASGVKGCARPATNVCPASTSANPLPRVGG